MLFHLKRWLRGKTWTPGRQTERKQRQRCVLTVEGLETRITPAFNLTISSAATANVLHDAVGDFTATGSGANINVADIRTDLLAGKNVTISNGATGTETGNITWLAGSDLDYNGVGTSLTLALDADPSSQSGAQVVLNAQIYDSVLSSADALSISISAQHDLTIANNIASGIGTILLQADAAGSGSGTLHVTAGAAVTSLNTATNSITLRAADIDIQSGSTVTADGTKVLTFIPGTTVTSNFITGLSSPTYDAVDSQGNLYVSIPGANTVDKFSAAGALVGNFSAGLSNPQGVAVDSSGNLYVASAGNDSIIEFPATGGSSTIASSGSLTSLTGLAVDTQHNVYAAFSSGIYKVGVGQIVSGLANPQGVATDSQNNIYVAENTMIQKYTSSGTGLGPVASGLAASVTGVAVNSSNTVFATLSNGQLYRVGIGVIATGLSSPVGLAADSQGNLYAVNQSNGTISKISPGQFSSPTYEAFDGSGNLYVSDTSTATVSKITPQGTVTTFVPASFGLSAPEGIAVDAQGNVYVADHTRNIVFEFHSDGSSAGSFGGFSGPNGIAVDQNNLYVANSGGSDIVKVALTGGLPTPIATGLSSLTGLAVDAQVNPNVYATYGGNSVLKVASTGGSTTILANTLSTPEGLAVDGQGSLFVANEGNGTITEIPTSGGVAVPYASGLSSPIGLAYRQGILYAANNGNGSISKIVLAGTVVVRSSVESRPMSLGGADNAVAGINLTDSELAAIVTGAYGSVTFGDSGQTGDMAFKTATPATTAGASILVLQSTTGPAKIVLDNDASGTPGIALNGNGGSIALTAGTGGIIATNPTGTTADIGTTSAVTLDTLGGIGSSTNRVQLDGTATPSSVVIGDTTQPANGVFLNSLGSLSLGTVSTNDAGVNVTTGGTLLVGGAISSGGGNISLNAGANAFSSSSAGTINAGSGAVSITADTITAIGAAVTGNGGITLQPSTAGRSIGLADPSGSFNLTASEFLKLFSTGTVTIGATTSGAITLGGNGSLNLSTDPYNLTIAGGSMKFNGTLTLDGNLTLATGAVSDANLGSGGDVVLGGGGSLQLQTSGNVGSSSAPLITQVADLGAGSVNGSVFLSNDQSLTTTGALSATGSVNITLPAGDFTTQSGDLNAAATTLTFSGSAAQKLTSGGQAITNLDHSGSGALTIADDLMLGGSFTNENGAGNLDITSRTIHIGGDWTWGNSGTLLSTFSTVVFDGSNQAISGNNTFYSLTKTVTTADTLTFQAGSTQFVSGVLMLKGTAGNLLSLRSSTPGSQWIINPEGYRSLADLDVQDSFNINAVELTPSLSTDSGDNVNWIFAAASAGTPAIIGMQGSGQSAAVGGTYNPLSVKVTDAFGNPLSGVSVTFTAPATGASGTFGNTQSTADTETTDASGIATTSETLTANTIAGTFAVVASAGLVSTSFTLTNTPGTASKLIFLSLPPSANTATAGQTISNFQVAVEDAHGNVVTGDQNALIVSLTNGSFSSGTTAVAAVDGVATFSGLVTEVAGANNVEVTDSADGVPAITAAIAINAASPALTTVLSGSGRTAMVGTSYSPLAVRVTDAFGNAVSGVSVTFTAPGGGPGGTFAVGNGSAASVAVSTDSSGVATAPAFTANESAGSFLVTAAGPGVADFSLTNQAGAAATVVTLTGTPQSAVVGNAYSPLEVLVTDSFGNPVANAAVTFTIVAASNGAGATFTGNSIVNTNGNGVAVAPTLSAGHVAGSFVVTASVTGANSVNFNLTNLSGAAANMTVAAGSPQSTIIGTAFASALQAVVVDSYGNPLANVPVTFTVPAAGPSGTFNALSTVVTDARGIATAPALTANHIQGSFAVIASAAGLGGTASFSLTNTIVPASIKVLAGSAQHATVNTNYAKLLQVRVTDAHGKPVAGITVTFELPGSGPSGTFAGSAAVVTNASGVATAPTLTANTVAGKFTINAWIAGVAKAASFTLTNNPGAPHSLSAVAGTPQGAAIGKAYSQRFEAQVVDSFNNPVSGIKVTFAAPASGPSGAFAGKTSVVAATNAVGIATAPAFTANKQRGGFSVTASASGLAPVSFSLTNS